MYLRQEQIDALMEFEQKLHRDPKQHELTEEERIAKRMQKKAKYQKYLERKKRMAEETERMLSIQNDPFAHVESTNRIFSMCKGTRFHKKPGNGGSFRVNRPLTGMSMNRRDYELNRKLY